MNRFLCDQNNSSTILLSPANEFSAKLGLISLYILPILALAGNSFILLVVQSNPQFNRSSFSVYIKSMAISDTLVLLLKFLSYQNKKSPHIYFPSLCTILIFCGEASVLLSVWLIVAITIERTLAVLFPLHKNKFISAYRARFIVIMIAILTILFSVRTLVIPIDTSIQQTKRCHPKFKWLSYRRINNTITDFAVCYIPLLIVIIGNVLTICRVKRAVIERQDMLSNSFRHQNKRQIDTNENQLMLMLLIVTLMFIVYFVPFTIINVISRWGLPLKICFTQKSMEIYIIIRAISELLKDLNFCTNFIIYSVSGRRFRYALISLFKRLYRRSSLSSSSFEMKRNRSDYLLKINSEQRLNRLSTRNTMEESQF